MSESSTNNTDVLIVGAGPTGLVLALWLTRLGVRVRIIDKTDGPGTTSRALAVQARTLELYGQMDLVASGQIDVSNFVSATYPLGRTPEAFEEYERNPGKVLRIVIDSTAT